MHSPLEKMRSLTDAACEQRGIFDGTMPDGIRKDLEVFCQRRGITFEEAKRRLCYKFHMFFSSGPDAELKRREEVMYFHELHDITISRVARLVHTLENFGMKFWKETLPLFNTFLEFEFAESEYVFKGQKYSGRVVLGIDKDQVIFDLYGSDGLSSRIYFELSIFNQETEEFVQAKIPEMFCDVLFPENESKENVISILKQNAIYANKIVRFLTQTN